MTHTKLVTVNITFRNTEATDALKAYGEEKIKHALGKFVHHDTDAHLILKVERNRQCAEVNFHTDGHDFFCAEERADLYASIDALVDTLSHQLRKHKDKITKHVK